jgi:hypothetical protein
VPIDGGWVLALTNDFEQVLVGQEVESGEDTSLAFEEGTEFFLDLLQASIHIRQSFDEVFNVDDQSTVAVLLFVYTGRLLSEDLINLLERCVFSAQLFSEIWLTLEDRFKVGPFALDLEQ